MALIFFSLACSYFSDIGLSNCKKMLCIDPIRESLFMKSNEGSAEECYYRSCMR